MTIQINIQTIHGFQGIPRGKWLVASLLVNDYGTPFGVAYRPARPGDTNIVILRDAPSCGCDGCMGLSDVWDQRRYYPR